jgi:hypothetical protein
MPGFQASKDGGLRGIAGVGIDKLCGKCWWGNTSVCSSSERLVHRIRPTRSPYRRDLRRLPREPRLELDLWELLELCDSPGRGRTIAVGQMAYLQTDKPPSSESRPVPSWPPASPTVIPVYTCPLRELLELCDSPGGGRTITVGNMAYLQTDTLLFAAVVTSGVSHRDRGVHMPPAGAAGAVRQPGRWSDDNGG